MHPNAAGTARFEHLQNRQDCNAWKSHPKNEEGLVIAGTSNREILRHWKMVTCSTELCVRRLKWYQSMARFPWDHGLVLASMFGHTKGEQLEGIPPASLKIRCWTLPPPGHCNSSLTLIALRAVMRVWRLLKLLNHSIFVCSLPLRFESNSFHSMSRSFVLRNSLSPFPLALKRIALTWTHSKGATCLAWSVTALSQPGRPFSYIFVKPIKFAKLPTFAL